MARNTFTKEELLEIRSNPYVREATTYIIRFTDEFKEEFWRRYSEEHQRPEEIVEELGFDRDVFGKKRIRGILANIKKQVNEGPRETPAVKNQLSDADEQSTAKRQNAHDKAFMKMQHQVAYMAQELEFIKKSILADNAARRKR
jgi:hypothetical protein